MGDPDRLAEELRKEFLGDDSEENNDTNEEEDDATVEDESNGEPESEDPYQDEELMKELYGESTCEGDCPPN